MNDIELKEYFHQNRPETADETAYLAGLSARMDAVSEIKRMHDESIRRYRRICIATFAIGCAVGMAVIAFILLKPVSATQFKTGLVASLYSFALEWKPFIVAAVAVIALMLGLLPMKKGVNISPLK